MLIACRAALVFLTRLPLSLPAVVPSDLNRRAMDWFAIVGVVVALCGGGVFALAYWAGMPASVAAGLCLMAEVLLTGSLHEDGLADVVDGLGGGRDRAHCLAILRDSRIGSYGVVALVLVLGLRAAALVALATPLPVLAALLVAESLSRGIMPLMAVRLPPARSDGLGVTHGRADSRAALLALGSGLLIAGLALAGLIGAGYRPPSGVEPWHWVLLQAVAVPLAAGTVLLLLARLALRRLGGYTGDVLGATQQLTATAILLTLTAG